MYFVRTTYNFEINLDMNAKKKLKTKSKYAHETYEHTKYNVIDL